jgi:UDP-glucose 6-dehydrogenase
MKVCIVGDSHAPEIFRQAARLRGVDLTSNYERADLVFIAQDIAVENGVRDHESIRKLCRKVASKALGALVLTSQVEPGFTRSLNLDIYYQAETLRMSDALQRALAPEQHIIGSVNPSLPLPEAYSLYIKYFPAKIVRCSYEEAEFSKIAINVSLASQVDTINSLFNKAEKLNLQWSVIREVLHNDHRMGRYLDPGEWRQSKHLLRDAVTFDRL